jgi:hypothetical protein
LFNIFDTEVRNNIFNAQLSSENGEENIDMSLPLPKILPTLSKLLGPILEQHYNLYLKVRILLDYHITMLIVTIGSIKIKGLTSFFSNYLL